jgi:hypothetical protein
MNFPESSNFVIPDQLSFGSFSLGSLSGRRPMTERINSNRPEQKTSQKPISQYLPFVRTVPFGKLEVALIRAGRINHVEEESKFFVRSLKPI